MTHNLEWRDIKALFESIGDVEEEHNGNWKVTLNGQATVFQAPNDSKTASLDQVAQIRHLLEGSDLAKNSDDASDILLVIDHQVAKIFHPKAKDSAPHRILPFDPDGSKAHVHPTGHEDSGRNQQPKHDAYFGQIAKALGDAEQILIFGAGTGSSSTMNLFVAWLKDHHHRAAEHVREAVVVDLGHLTDGELLAKARDIFNSP